MNKQLFDMIELVTTYNLKCFQERWSKFRIDIADVHTATVLGSLLARQATLANEFLNNPGTWNPNTAPLFLRAMGDCYINFEWIKLEPSKRSLEFIHYGIGQEFAFLEHLKSSGLDKDENGLPTEMYNAMHNWANNQRWQGIAEINLGNWSGASVRKMAQESDNMSFYNYVYSPFSSAVHSTWQHVGKYNVKRCRNPLHKYHLVPDVKQFDVDFFYVANSQKYFDQILLSFDEYINVESSLESPLDYTLNLIDGFIAPLQEQS